MPRTEAFLAHNAIPVQFTPEDFDQVLTGNFVTKVIYLPDPEYQELALAGVETLVSTRLDPGVDPIVEADRRGAILAHRSLGQQGSASSRRPSARRRRGCRPRINARSKAAKARCPPPPMPLGMPVGGLFDACPTDYIAGVTAPQYGMPMCGTPIGLPGPPSACRWEFPPVCRSTSLKNHTRVHLPEPTEQRDGST